MWRALSTAALAVAFGWAMIDTLHTTLPLCRVANGADAATPTAGTGASLRSGRAICSQLYRQNLTQAGVVSA